MYETSWYNSGDIVPDQVTPASDAIPSNSIVNGSAGTSNEYARGDHQHPLQVSTVLPAKDTANGEVGEATTYARSDHTHHVNLGSDIPLKDTGTGTAATANIYASATHQHPLNVDPTTANVPLVNATAAANGTSDFYSRNDHVHPQQLTYTGPLTSTMFIKNGAQATDILLAGGDSKPISDIAGDGFVAKTGKTLQSVEGVLRHSGDDEESEDDEDYITRGYLYNQYVSKASPDTITGRKIFKNDYFQLQPAGSNNPLLLFNNNNGFLQQIVINNELILVTNSSGQAGNSLYINYRDSSLSSQYPNSKLVTKYVLNAGSSTSFAGVVCGAVQINPTTANYSQGLRISRSTAGCGIYLGTDQQTSGTVQNQWQIVSQPSNFEQNPLGLTIGLSSESGAANRGLRISADGNTLTFNGSVIAGTGAINGATNGSVNYSAGNPILWGVNSTDPIGGFYSNGTNIYIGELEQQHQALFLHDSFHSHLVSFACQCTHQLQDFFATPVSPQYGHFLLKKSRIPTAINCYLFLNK
ncbi:MAG: hypothetical protein EZS28_019745 [Streblomastix strix]|uniref:Uncharacterized protein n=1 Tax=Streblomastix strix TaxID=222440 RepID=A0A5J4VQU8_9EUKA|nr:MAG: hypothetical protein EZS28_019745 [Streblomastix strix]